MKSHERRPIFLDREGTMAVEDFLEFRMCKACGAKDGDLERMVEECERKYEDATKKMMECSLKKDMKIKVPTMRTD